MPQKANAAGFNVFLCVQFLCLRLNGVALFDGILVAFPGSTFCPCLVIIPAIRFVSVRLIESVTNRPRPSLPSLPSFRTGRHSSSQKPGLLVAWRMSMADRALAQCAGMSPIFFSSTFHPSRTPVKGERRPSRQESGK